MTASQWGHEDRALMLALRAHRRTECPRCGNPKATAWHVDNDGHWEAKAEYICHPCSVRAGDDVKFTVVVDTRDYAADPLHGSYTDFAAVDAAAGAAAPQVAGPAPAGEVALGG